MFINVWQKNWLMTERNTAKLHVSQEVANLVKVYCVLNKKGMAEFANEVFKNVLSDFKKKLEKLNEI